jgi:hypothetical protein
VIAQSTTLRSLVWCRFECACSCRVLLNILGTRAESRCAAPALTTNCYFQDLSGNDLGAGACLLLSNSSGLENLEALSLRGSNLDDTCSSPLAELLKRCPLQRIELAQNDFSYYGEALLHRSSQGPMGQHTVVGFEESKEWVEEAALRDGDWRVLQEYDSVADKAALMRKFMCWCGWQGVRSASDEVKELFGDDKDLVREACKQDPRAFAFASNGLRSDKGFVLELLQDKSSHGVALKYAHALQSDREVVLAAVKCSGTALQFACEELRADKDIVLQAIRSSWTAISFAADDLRNCQEVKIAAQYWKDAGCAPLARTPNWGNN